MHGVYSHPSLASGRHVLQGFVLVQKLVWPEEQQVFASPADNASSSLLRLSCL